VFYLYFTFNSLFRMFYSVFKHHWVNVMQLLGDILYRKCQGNMAS
jgi:hypothetical protein